MSSPRPGTACQRMQHRPCVAPTTLAVLALALLASGCIPVLKNRVDASAITAARVVAMPPVVVVNTLDFYGNFTPNREASRAVAVRIESYLGSIMQFNGSRVATPAELDACGAVCEHFMKWGALASLEIGAQRAQVRNYGSHSVADWAYRRNLPLLRSSFAPDYVLFTVFKQTRETKGQKAGNVLLGAWTVGKQIDAACIVDIRDGRMAWCATKHDDSNDLTDGSGRALDVLAELLSDVFRIRGRD